MSEVVEGVEWKLESTPFERHSATIAEAKLYVQGTKETHYSWSVDLLTKNMDYRAYSVERCASTADAKEACEKAARVLLAVEFEFEFKRRFREAL